MSTKYMCEVCFSSDLTTVLDLGDHPLCDDLIEIGSQEVCEEYKIEIAMCNKCLTAHQLHPVPKRKLFPSSYHYRSSMTQDVLEGMQSLVSRASQHLGGLRGKLVVDIGCNDGSLLKYFRDHGANVLGVEPTEAAKDSVKSGIRTINDFFDSNIANSIITEVGHPDIITFTNVFAHIEDMGGLIDSVRILMGENTTLIIENHYLGSVLDKFQFDTFYHEHPRTYSAHSFVEIAARLERYVEIIEFPSRYGGNIRVFIGLKKTKIDDINLILGAEKNFLQKFDNMRNVIKIWIKNRNDLLSMFRENDGKIFCKAFPGRAAILVKMLNLTEEEIGGVFEKPNSMKIGNYVPGTRIPILSEDLMLEVAPPPRKILNLAWHISNEIHSYVESINKGYKCVDIFSPAKYLRK